MEKIHYAKGTAFVKAQKNENNGHFGNSKWFIVGKIWYMKREALWNESGEFPRD